MKKYRNDILVFMLFVLILFATIMTRELNNLDEVWIFNTARNIANGLLPYQDFNLITTPGLPILCGMILKIFGTEMFIMRIMATIVSSIIIFMVYKILRILEFKEIFSVLISISILSLFIDSICIDYNFMILLIALISLYNELKGYKKTNNIFQYSLKKEVLLGCFSGLTIIFKQTTGLVYIIVFIGYKILSVRNKEEFKQFLKIATTRLISAMIPTIILLIYLMYNNLFHMFWDYAILGIKEFTNRVSYLNLLRGNLNLLAMIVPIAIITSLILALKNKDINIILFGYSISTIIVVYPIADNVHFLISATIALIALMHLVKIGYEKVKNIFEDITIVWIENFVKNITIIMVIILIIVSVYKSVIYFSEMKNYSELNNFKYIPVSEELEQEIINVNEYIEEQGKVYILDARAAIYMIPLNKYNKNYDMFLIGNIGSKGSSGIISDLKSKEDVKLLIIKDEKALNWQTPIDVIKFIKENYIKTEEIRRFDVYSAKH